METTQETSMTANQRGENAGAEEGCRRAIILIPVLPQTASVLSLGVSNLPWHSARI